MEKVKSFSGKKALLIGNGINLLDVDQSVSWRELLARLKQEGGVGNIDLDNDFKPFPLAFEEMLHLKSGDESLAIKARELKQMISGMLKDQLKNRTGFNQYHLKIAQSKVDEILTTNYDYGIENSVIADFDKDKSKLAGYKREIRHSLRRFYKLEKENKRVWHIHGELEDCRNINPESKYYHEESIMIGYEHYTQYLAKIQENFTGKRGARKEEDQSLITRIKNGNAGLYWFDFFFTHDVYILGLGFDFSENHLWWLINQRANFIKSNYTRVPISINNNITFLIPEIDIMKSSNYNSPFESWYRNKVRTLKTQAVTDILPAFKVKVEKVPAISYFDFYDIVIEKYFHSN